MDANKTVNTSKRIEKSRPIVHRFIIPILTILALQSLTFIAVLLYSGAIDQLDQNSFRLLSQQTYNRENILENQMVTDWSSITGTQEIITQTFETIVTQNGEDFDNISDETSIEVLDAVMDEMLLTLRASDVTDVFVVLECDPDSIEKKGIHITDSAPTTNSATNADLSIVCAPTSITKNFDISLSSYWQPTFTLDPTNQNYAFYYKPLDAAKEHPDYETSDLAYWSPPSAIDSDTYNSRISYSVPLRASDGTVFGILGTALTIDYFVSNLPYEQIGFENKGSFILGKTKNNNYSEIEVLLSSGPTATYLFGGAPFIEANDVDVSSDETIFSLTPLSHIDDSVYTSILPIRLYNSNTPFESENWLLLGVLEEAYLLSSSSQITNVSLFSTLLSVILAIVAAFLISMRVTKPISSLVQTMQENQASLSFKKTNILEIDRLADTIVLLNKEASDSASRLSQILDATDISIGAYEYENGAEYVYVAGKFFSPFLRKEKTKLTIGEFNKFINSISHLLVEQTEENSKIYSLIDAENNHIWLRLKNICIKDKQIGILTDITQETLEKQRIQYERDYDLLTNLMNRRAFHATVKELFKNTDNLKVSAFMLWDLDNLKSINDTYGHNSGDDYIRNAANILQHFQSYKNTVVARMSGDEFYVFLYGYESKQEIQEIVSKIHHKFGEFVFELPNNKITKIRVSAGIAWYPDDATEYDNLIKYADFAMYTAKNNDKGTLALFDRTLYEKDSFLLDATEELHNIIENNLINYAFQPIICAATGKIFAHEALMRPQSETLRSPLDVLRIAREQSKLGEIERISVFRSLDCFMKTEAIKTDCKLFINTLSNQILSASDVELFALKYKDHLSRLVFEFLESEKMQEHYALRKIDYASKWGSEIAIDDFGTGYNSESILLAVRPQYVKIDMSLIRNIDTDKNRQIMLQNFIGYLKKVGTKVVAEGVETKAELYTLLSYGVDYLQGYYFAKPQFTPVTTIEHESDIVDYYKQ